VGFRESVDAGALMRMSDAFRSASEETAAAGTNFSQHPAAGQQAFGAGDASIAARDAYAATRDLMATTSHLLASLLGGHGRALAEVARLYRASDADAADVAGRT